MAVYDKKYEVEGASSYKETFSMENFHLYGSERLGTYAPKEDQKEVASRTFVVSKIDTVGAFEEVTTKIQSTQLVTMDFLNHYIGNSSYEGKNHLGNVLVVFTDAKGSFDRNNDGLIDAYEAVVVSASDYYPFGSPMPNRKFSGVSYRYGFNGMEKDDEVKGEGNSYDFGARIFDSRLARFLSIDPLIKKYPQWSPYLYAVNNPIRFIDIYGEGPGDPVVFHNSAGKGNVLIYLVDEGMDFNLDPKTNTEVWDVIAVTNLEHAVDILEKTYGEAAKINNLVIRTHGDGAGELYAQNTTAGTEERHEFMDSDDFSGAADTYFEKTQKNAFKGIFSYLGEDATIVMGACGLGEKSVGEAIYKLAIKSAGVKNVSVYANKDFSTMTTKFTKNGDLYPYLQRFRFDEELTADDSFISGWVLITKDATENLNTTPVGEGKMVPIVDDDSDKVGWVEKKTEKKEEVGSSEKSKDKNNDKGKNGTSKL